MYTCTCIHGGLGVGEEDARAVVVISFFRGLHLVTFWWLLVVCCEETLRSRLAGVISMRPAFASRFAEPEAPEAWLSATSTSPFKRSRFIKGGCSGKRV